MFKYIVESAENGLSGLIDVYGSKNIALTTLPCALLTNDDIKFTNIPHVQDVTSMMNILNNIGVDISMDMKKEGSVNINFRTRSKINNTIGYETVSKMRASILFLGPMLAKFGEVKLSLPGGCAIGVRPVDLHIFAMKKLGAEITLENGLLVAKAPTSGLIGNVIDFPKNTVGGTENALMAAVLASGTTVIKNAAIEPEVVELCRLLKLMGADISGEGSREITVVGKKSLHGCEYRVQSDRIQAVTYGIISAATGFGISLNGCDEGNFLGVTDVLEKIGIKVVHDDNEKVTKFVKLHDFKSVEFSTEPIPGFPTDCQAQVMALLSVVSGTSVIHETIFENRMMHVGELVRMGADISINGNTATINGVQKLTGTTVMASDLRASACLVIAGLLAKGTTVIDRIYHIERGYDFMTTKLETCGAKIRKVFD